ncbi:hypothetical protein M0802_005294 [Mischocyttarus mexicanus]|nr:hypothetical protein M0802_005294 [Mischocyttarus mexicanus]
MNAHRNDDVSLALAILEYVDEEVTGSFNIKSYFLDIKSYDHILKVNISSFCGKIVILTFHKVRIKHERLAQSTLDRSFLPQSKVAE